MQQHTNAVSAGFIPSVEEPTVKLYKQTQMMLTVWPVL
jgi:hypothetical protein